MHSEMTLCPHMYIYIKEYTFSIHRQCIYTNCNKTNCEGNGNRVGSYLDFLEHNCWPHLMQIGRDSFMGQHGALGKTGRPATVGKHTRVIARPFRGCPGYICLHWSEATSLKCWGRTRHLHTHLTGTHECPQKPLHLGPQNRVRTRSTLQLQQVLLLLLRSR